MAFDIFDPRKLPEKKEDLIQYSDNELWDLGECYGMWKVNRFESKVHTQDADIDNPALTAEWPLFKSIMHEKHLSYRSKVNRDVNRANPENVQEFIKKRESYTLQKLWDDLKRDNVVKEIYPNCIYLLQLFLIFPISIACVERLFSQMRLVKTRLGNQLKQSTLDSLFCITTESPLSGFVDGDFDRFVDELKWLNPNMRLKT